ncbi:hypothetical protein [Azospirillum brasilense]|uniref:hypothetical protein n=1 Tax=Azospirillum brasilense TaxID=192 RepID=UPI001EDBC425|nr:hypothetical protein [Azospirillum brasilense]UKJ73458.1 hypothetical protein H1Q64_02245 [Azospirillum brasilense]
MSSLLGISRLDLAIELIRWRARLSWGTVELPGPLEMARHFANHLLHRNPERHQEVIEVAVEDFFAKHRRLTDWWSAVLTSGDIDVKVYSCEPRIARPSLANWRSAMARLDHDALVTLNLLGQSPAPCNIDKSLQALSKWRVFPGIWDPDLSTICARGLADTHVHFEASDPVPVLWARLMAEDVRLEAVPRYNDAKLEEIRSNGERLSNRLWERDLIQDAMTFRRRTLRHWRESLDVPKASRTASSAEHLYQERWFLMHSWQRLLAGYNRLHGDENQDFEKGFDQYLVAKSIFLSEQQQFPGSGAGLSRFREYLDRAEPLSEKRAVKAPRALRQRMRRLADLALECPSTRRLELRIAPKDKAVKWFQYMRNWKQVRNGLDGPYDIGFVVHFIRNPKARSTNLGHFGSLRADLDRKTAILHLFRHKHPALASSIVGLDVANLERGCAPDIFIPFLRLLRGDVGPLATPDSAERIVPEHWSRLSDRGLHVHSFTLPRLGQTYHAGEDFFHVVTGLRHIDLLVTHLLEQRDRIGHGLALGLDTPMWLARNHSRIQMPQGVLLDDLVWLRKTLLVAGALPPADLADIDREICKLSQAIYGKVIPVSVLELLADERTHLPPRPTPEGQGSMDDPVHLFAHETWNREVQRKRDSIAGSKSIAVLNAQAPRIAHAQKVVCEKMYERGICLEINPTSNMTTGAVKNMQEHPAFNILKMTEGRARISVNTDDPGVFATRLDQEFAILLDTIVKQKEKTLPEALLLIEKLRECGYESTFLTI